MSMWDDKCPKCGKENRSTIFCACLMASQNEPNQECQNCDGSGIHEHGTVECLDCGTTWRTTKKISHLVNGKPVFYQLLSDHGTGGVMRVCTTCSRFFRPVDDEWNCGCAPIGDALEQDECYKCSATFTPDPEREGQHLCPPCEAQEYDHYHRREDGALPIGAVGSC